MKIRVTQEDIAKAIDAVERTHYEYWSAVCPLAFAISREWTEKHGAPAPRVEVGPTYIDIDDEYHGSWTFFDHTDDSKAMAERFDEYCDDCVNGMTPMTLEPCEVEVPEGLLEMSGHA